MSRLRPDIYNIARATEDELREVFSSPPEFPHMWPEDGDHEDLIKYSFYVYKGEVGGVLCGACGVKPFSLVSDKAWVWTRAMKAREASEMYMRFAPLYIQTVLEYVYPVLYVTIHSEKAQRYSEWLGFKRDPDFERKYGVNDRKIFVRKLDG